MKEVGEYTFRIRGTGKIEPKGLTITFSNQAGDDDSVYSINNFTDQGQGYHTFQHTFDDVFAHKAKEEMHIMRFIPFAFNLDHLS